jgi:hypothetical protein
VGSQRLLGYGDQRDKGVGDGTGPRAWGNMIMTQVDRRRIYYPHARRNVDVSRLLGPGFSAVLVSPLFPFRGERGNSRVMHSFHFFFSRNAREEDLFNFS